MRLGVQVIDQLLAESETQAKNEHRMAKRTNNRKNYLINPKFQLSFIGYNVGISVVFGMTLGIIVDDTVHFLSKYLRAIREQGKSPADAVRYAFQTVGRALIVTTIVLTAGFLVLAQSKIK